MPTPQKTPRTKTVTASGHLSLGKRFAGVNVVIDESEPDVLTIRIPRPEAWLHTPKAAADLRAALAWTTKNPPSDTEGPDVLTRLADHAAKD